MVRTTNFLVFKIQQNGLLGQPQVYKANGIEPRAFSFDESGKYLYVTNVYSNNISLFRFDTKNGSLKPLGDAAKISTQLISNSFNNFFSH